jgi:hypothetical protein
LAGTCPAGRGWTSYWTEQLKKPLLPFEWFADEDAHFLWHLVHDVNLAILTNAQANTDLRNLVHCALYGLLGKIARIDDAGIFVPVRPIAELATCLGEYLYTKLQGIFQEKFCLAVAVDELSEIYLGDDQDILFADSRAILDTELSNLRETAVTFAPMAEWFNVQSIAMEAYMSGDHMVPRWQNSQMFHESTLSCDTATSSGSLMRSIGRSQG